MITADRSLGCTAPIDDVSKAHARKGKRDDRNDPARNGGKSEGGAGLGSSSAFPWSGSRSRARVGSSLRISRANICFFV
jgi:hypothetical protein